MKKNIFTDDIKRIFENLSLKEKNYLRNKRILILGSNGFIGRYFLYFFDYLNRHKYNLKIDCYDNGISSATLKNELKNIRSANISFYKKDINKIKFKKKYNIILFLAGIATPSIYKKYPLETLDTSFIGLKNCLDSIKNKRTNFLYFSSSEIYGNPGKSFIPTKENFNGNVSSIGDRSCYDESKRSGETFSYMYKEYYNLNVKIIGLKIIIELIIKNFKKEIYCILQLRLNKNLIKLR